MAAASATISRLGALKHSLGTLTLPLQGVYLHFSVWLVPRQTDPRPYRLHTTPHTLATMAAQTSNRQASMGP